MIDLYLLLMTDIFSVCFMHLLRSVKCLGNLFHMMWLYITHLNEDSLMAAPMVLRNCDQNHVM